MAASRTGTPAATQVEVVETGQAQRSSEVEHGVVQVRVPRVLAWLRPIFLWMSSVKAIIPRVMEIVFDLVFEMVVFLALATFERSLEILTVGEPTADVRASSITKAICVVCRSTIRDALRGASVVVAERVCLLSSVSPILF